MFLKIKQVALVVYLAQVGRYASCDSTYSCMRIIIKRHSFVPAESAEVGITDKIFFKSNTQDSVSQVNRQIQAKSLTHTHDLRSKAHS